MSPVIENKYRGSGQYSIVFAELVNAARYRGTVTYQELAELIGIPVTGNYMGTEIGHLLGEISEDEHSRKRPLLSAVAVGVDGTPGPGFFSMARKIGRLTDTDEESFWGQEKQAVYSRWRRQF